MKQPKKTLLLLAGMVMTAIIAMGQTPETARQNYFKARIANSNEENIAVAYKGRKKLKASQVDQAKEEIWTIWKSVNNELEQLPAFTPSTDEEPTLHHWELIDEDPMPFYLLRKEDEAGTQQKPLFINLHGSGPKEREFSAALRLGKAYEDAPSVYFIPQIPNEKRYRWWFQPIQNTWERLFRLAMLNDEIDPNKIHVMGISEGGYGSQRVGAYYADYLAGVGPMAGGEPLKNAPPVNLRHVAFSFHTGENDTAWGRNDLTRLVGSVLDSLEQQHPGDFVHNVVIQEGRGHHVDYTLTTPWLVKHERRTAPQSISWVYFPMHECYRKGFYNVGIKNFPGLKEADEFNRILFNIDYNKQRNEITIDTHLMSDDMSELKPTNGGEISLYLDDRYVNYSKRVKVIHNGKVVFNSKLKLREEHIVSSCALFGDPERLFPARVDVKL